MPAVGGVAGGDVLGEGDGGVVLDGDLVVVVDHHQIAQLLGARQRGRLGSDALLQVAVGGDDVDVVIERAGTGGGVRIEQAALAAGGHRHADRGGQTLAERAGGDLDAVGVPELGVARGQRAPLAQVLQIVEFEPETGQVQLDVLGEAGVTAREHETVAADPARIGRVVAHDALVEHVGQRREAHRGTGVTVARVLHRVRGQHPDRVDRLGVQVRPVGRMVRLGEGADVVCH